ncbi:MAG: hypothetical protein U0168_07800 [Nannocystaceae bacterium]
MGHSRASGYSSCSVSAIASESHTGCSSPPSPIHSTGTWPEGVIRGMRASHAGVSNGTMTSSKGMPAWRISTHGRIDHDE